MLMIRPISTDELEKVLPQLTEILIDSVHDGASVGFIPPLAEAEAQAYWRSRRAGMESGDLVLLGAWQGEQLVGTAQLGLEQRANGNHRGEVMKLLVHTQARRQGIGRELMLALETLALEEQRSLLVLDTRHGDPSNFLYASLGYQLVGIIPNYARSANGELDAGAFYYKLI